MAELIEVNQIDDMAFEVGPVRVDSSPSWSCDDDFVYYRHEASDVGDAGGIYRVEVYDGWREPILLDGVRRAYCPKASPVRPELAVVIAGELHVFDLAQAHQVFSLGRVKPG